MDTTTSPVFTQTIKSNVSPTAALAESREIHDGVVLRQLAEVGGFARTIKCLAGSVTLIPVDAGGEFEIFRQALIGERGQSTPVSIRDGSRELHPSEVHLVGSAEYLRKELTVVDVLIAAGAPKESATEILREIGLEELTTSSPKELGVGALRRLAAACAFFNKSRVIAFDRPFDDLQKDWVPILAKLILQGAKAGNRIVVVLGGDKVPDIWANNPLVQCDLGQGQADASQGVRQMLRDNNLAETALPYFVTRPLAIHKRPRQLEDVLKAEQIPSPHLAELCAQSLGEISSSQALEAGAEIVHNGQLLGNEQITPISMRRQATGKLTRVTSGKKLMRNSLVSGLRDEAQKFIKLFRRTRSEKVEALPGSAKIKKAVAQVFEQKVILLILLCLMIGMLFLNWR